MKIKLISILIAIGLASFSCQLSSRTNLVTHYKKEPMDTVQINICIRSSRDSLPTDAIIGFVHGSKKTIHFNDNQGCATFRIIPSEWTYLEIYSDRLEGIYEINPFRFVNREAIDTVIYLKEYEIRSNQNPKH